MNAPLRQDAEPRLEDFPFRVTDNVRYGRPDATDDEVRAACEAAYATEFVERLPEKYASFLGDLSAMLRKSLEMAPSAVRDRAWREVERESERHLLPDGRLRLTNEVRCVSGAR